jgi:hypothetical protein
MLQHIRGSSSHRTTNKQQPRMPHHTTAATNSTALPTKDVRSCLGQSQQDTASRYQQERRSTTLEATAAAEAGPLTEDVWSRLGQPQQVACDLIIISLGGVLDLAQHSLLLLLPPEML